ncbi:2-hydroxyacyl-CoA dehydratase family protein [Microbacterium sp. Marseille-Q6965]|uniref:2-hydroxyacyl-CoA dehydratase family protein n=1 Tax=Microbacterium sp. Marseille-Q6965 TaxID=2965072 RepID=UPI0021B78291|nr:2-hydroxyacyl-CoA dehydratase family protein [Microbacterium sp. Marseille-Q6965]
MTEAPRIGIVGADVPRQLVLAAGATPVRLLGSWSGAYAPETAELPGAVDAVACRILDALLAGAHDDLAGLIVCNDSAANLRVFYVLRVLAERGRVPFPVHLLDAPRGGGAPRDRFVIRQYERLVRFVVSLTGRPAEGAALRDAAEREVAVGAALARMRDRRAAGRCSGQLALAAYRAAATLPPEHAIAVVDAAVDAAAGHPIFVTGSAHPDGSVYAAIESAGLVVAGEDHDTGDAAWIGDAVATDDAGEAIARLAAHHAQRLPLAARSRSRERADALARRLDAGAPSGILALVRELDDAPAWDLAAQRALAAARGIPLEERVRIGPDVARGVAADAAGALAGRLTGEAAR